MELRFKRKSSTSMLVAWLKGFKDVHTSLLVEVDVNNKEFIAKSFPSEKVIVKYSKLSFEDAGLELVAVVDNAGNEADWSMFSSRTESGRVYMGIYQVLSKAIDVFGMFSEVEHDLTVTFDLCNDVKYYRAKEAIADFEATAIVLQSSTLRMVVKCGQLSEFFEKLTDELFLNRVCNIGSPSVFEITSEAIQTLGKVSSVFSNDKSRDVIKFYSKSENGKRALYAYDESNQRYDCMLGYLVDGANIAAETNVYRENFMTSTKGLVGDTIKVTLDTAGASRMLIEVEDAKVVVAAVTSN